MLCIARGGWETLECIGGKGIAQRDAITAQLCSLVF